MALYHLTSDDMVDIARPSFLSPFLVTPLRCLRCCYDLLLQRRSLDQHLVAVQRDHRSNRSNIRSMKPTGNGSSLWLEWTNHSHGLPIYWWYPQHTQRRLSRPLGVGFPPSPFFSCFGVRTEELTATTITVGHNNSNHDQVERLLRVFNRFAVCCFDRSRGTWHTVVKDTQTEMCE